MTHLPAHFGIMRTPHAYGISAGIVEGRPWAADNAAFTKGFDPDLFLPFLESLMPYKATCLFVVCPDAVGDARETLRLWGMWYPTLVFYGFPVAFVGQDGLEPNQIPDDARVFFIGGTTEYKIGVAARNAARRAKDMGKWLHVGRVNTLQRLKYATLLNADSVDGTCIAFGRDVNLARLNRWMPALNAQRRIW